VARGTFVTAKADNYLWHLWTVLGTLDDEYLERTVMQIELENHSALG
jgi:hypothetical protein